MCCAAPPLSTSCSDTAITATATVMAERFHLAPHGTHEDSGSAKLPDDYPYKTLMQRKEYENEVRAANRASESPKLGS